MRKLRYRTGRKTRAFWRSTFCNRSRYRRGIVGRKREADRILLLRQRLEHQARSSITRLGTSSGQHCLFDIAPKRESASSSSSIRFGNLRSKPEPDTSKCKRSKYKGAPCLSSANLAFRLASQGERAAWIKSAWATRSFLSRFNDTTFPAGRMNSGASFPGT